MIPSMRHLPLAAVLCLSCLTPPPPGRVAEPPPSRTADDTHGWFPFTLDGLDASATPTDVSFLNAEPAGASGFVRAKSGHFVDGAGRRIRFFGTNLTATACFPDKADAPKIARHLRKLGINVVRFHFMDNGGAPNGLFASDKRSFDPEQLDKLDFLIAELKKNGIYANLNLHVARRYPGIEGEAAKRFDLGKVLDRFYPPFIEMQKEYARALVGHKNPYTGRTYADEPAVLCIELNNENTIFPFWGGSTDGLPEPYGSELVKQWNAWLKGRYGTTADLAAAWSQGQSGAGKELLRNAGEAASWVVQDTNGVTSKLERVEGGLRWSADRAGTELWHLQIFQTGLPLEDGKTYTVTLEARLGKGSQQDVEVSAMLDQADWHNVGLTKTAILGPDYRTFEWSFRAENVVQGHGRLNISLRNEPGVVELRSVRLRTGAPPTLSAGQTIEASSVPLPSGAGAGAQADDYARFLYDTEHRATKAVADVLRVELKAKSPIVNTQASYGGVYGILRETSIGDFVDMHGYWQHPSFPAGWSNTRWTIRNVSQIGARDGGTLAGMAVYRVAGYPFSVSEYNTPTPNDYAAETLPLYSAFAALQDWDAIYFYTFLDFKTAWQADKLLGFFDFAGHPGKLVFAPAAALAFRRGLVRASVKPVTLALPKDMTSPGSSEGTLSTLWAKLGVPQKAAATRALAVRLVEGKGEPSVSEKVDPGDVWRSDTGEIAWASGGADGAFTVTAPGLRLAAGPLAGRKIEVGDVAIEVGRMPRPYACVEMVAIDGKPIAQSSRVVLAVAARVENRHMGWNSDRSTVGKEWGEGPTIAEPVPITVTVPGTGWKAQALDGRGAPKEDIVTVAAGGGTRISVQTPTTLWYALTR
jgi:hypothetical protein